MTEKNCLHTIGDYFRDFWPEISTGILNAALLLLPFLATDEGFEILRVFKPSFVGPLGAWKTAVRVLLLLSTVAVYMLTIYVEYKKSSRQKSFALMKEELNSQITALTKELASEKDKYSEFAHCVKDLIKGILANYGQIKLEFGQKKENTERINLYILDRGNSAQFFLGGRYSQNPKYDVCGRTYYPTNQGIIGDVWENGVAFENKIPSYSDKNCGEFLKSKYKMSDDTIKDLTMPSRCLYGFRVSDREGKPNGIVIIESTDHKRFSQSSLDSIFGEGEKRFLGTTIEKLVSFMSSPHDAGKAGL